jgi:hypothetical protein
VLQRRVVHPAFGGIIPLYVKPLMCPEEELNLYALFEHMVLFTLK